MPTLEPVLDIRQTIDIDAPIERAFQATLDQFGPASVDDHGQSLNLKIEPFPGGRWYRDLGHDNGHLWGFVQVIKRPFLIELCGPMFMSDAALNFIQIRLTERPAGVTLHLHHRAIGMVPQEHKEGIQTGWKDYLQAMKDTGEAPDTA